MKKIFYFFAFALLFFSCEKETSEVLVQEQSTENNGLKSTVITSFQILSSGNGATPYGEPCIAFRSYDFNWVSIDAINTPTSTVHTLDFSYNYGNTSDYYLFGDWDGDGIKSIAVVRGNQIYMENDWDRVTDVTFSYGNSTDVYYAGDWDADGKDEIAVRRGHTIYLNYNNDTQADLVFTYGKDDDRFVVGDWDGNGRDDFAIVRGHTIYLNYNFDGTADFVYTWGNDSDYAYFAGDWDNDGKDEMAIGRENYIYFNYNHDSTTDRTYKLDYGFYFSPTTYYFR